MTRQEINKQLQRNILSGKNYDRYFKPSSNTTEKLATGNTKVAINQMKNWILKHHFQCAKIAPVLYHKDLETTINNIHGFWYWHVQYSIDGKDQNLKSPYRTWQTRKEGTDCKSFSIACSSTLLQLGIKHYLRRIQQPGVMEDAYTHVYVVIPKDQKTGKLNNNYFVLDATINPNIEVPFTKTDEIYMEPELPIYGLAYTPTTGDNVIFEGFNNFLNLLLALGVSQEVIDTIVFTFNKYLSKGIDPNKLYFKITNFGIFIGQDYISYRSQTETARGVKTSFKNAVKYVEGLNPENKPNQSKIYFALAGTGEGHEYENRSNTQTQDGEVQDLDTLIEGISESGWFDSTFGAVFSNGFDFSCWGSSNSPEKAKKEVEQDSIWILEQSGLKTNINKNTIQKFLDWTNLYKHARYIGKNNGDLARCTRKGNEVGYDRIIVFRDEILKSIRQSLSKQGKELKTQPYTKEWLQIRPPSGYLDGLINYNNFLSDKVVSITNIPVLDQNTGNNTGTGTNTGTGIEYPPYNPTPTNPTNNSNGNIQTAGTGVMEKVLLGGLVAGAVMYFIKNKKK